MPQDFDLQLDFTSKTNKGCRRYYRDSSLVSVTNCLPPFSNLEYFVPKLAKPEFSLLAAP